MRRVEFITKERTWAENFRTEAEARQRMKDERFRMIVKWRCSDDEVVIEDDFTLIIKGTNYFIIKIP